MPYALNQYRPPRQRAGLSAAQIVKLAKSAMQLKKAYQAEKKKHLVNSVMIKGNLVDLERLM